MVYSEILEEHKPLFSAHAMHCNYSLIILSLCSVDSLYDNFSCYNSQNEMLIDL